MELELRSTSGRICLLERAWLPLVMTSLFASQKWMLKTFFTSGSIFRVPSNHLADQVNGLCVGGWNNFLQILNYLVIGGLNKSTWQVGEANTCCYIKALLPGLGHTPNQFRESVKHIRFGGAWKQGITSEKFCKNATCGKNIRHQVVMLLSQHNLWCSVPSRRHVVCLGLASQVLLRKPEVCYFQCVVMIE